MRRRITVFAALAVLSAVVAVAATAAVLSERGSGRPVLLTIFVGTANLQRGAAPAAPARSGDLLGDGDAVTTGADGKASLTYPDGSVTRLDSSTHVLVHVTQSGGSVRTRLVQSAGLTWNSVRHLLGGSSFKVSGPNSSSAEVRGTRFGFYVEHDAKGNPVIWIDVYDGAVGVKGALGGEVLAKAGQRVTVRPQSAPTQPVPIPTGDLRLSFTVFNQTIEAVTATPSAFASGTLSSGSSTTFAFDSDGKHDLQFVLGWPDLAGSTFAMTVVAPDGSVFEQTQAQRPPIIIVSDHALAGTWLVTVRDIASSQPQPWWVIIGRS
ncbi:MAG TPA: FecR family protein [Candidatus Dormibacteraeota bacterium]|nr:FecR family protein [Candidatus Dormibacteraeota bacterium]